MGTKMLRSKSTLVRMKLQLPNHRFEGTAEKLLFSAPPPFGLWQPHKLNVLNVRFPNLPSSALGTLQSSLVASVGRYLPSFAEQFCI
jgi:hypothetical protein